MDLSVVYSDTKAWCDANDNREQERRLNETNSSNQIPEIVATALSMDVEGALEEVPGGVARQEQATDNVSSPAYRRPVASKTP